MSDLIKEYYVLIPVPQGGYACVATFDIDRYQDAKEVAENYQGGLVARTVYSPEEGEL